MGNETGPQSLLTAMNAFIGSVNQMDNTILVPSRLMDMTPTQNTDSLRTPAAITNKVSVRDWIPG